MSKSMDHFVPGSGPNCPKCSNNSQVFREENDRARINFRPMGIKVTSPFTTKLGEWTCHTCAHNFG